MKKITKEEASSLLLRKGRSSTVRTALLHLQPGEILMVDKKEWNQKNGPGQTCTRITKSYGMKFKVNSIADGSGWVIERTM